MEMTYLQLLNVWCNHGALATPAGHEVDNNRLARLEQGIILLLVVDDSELGGILHSAVDLTSTAEVLKGFLCIGDHALGSRLPVSWTHLDIHSPTFMLFFPTESFVDL